MKKVTRILFVLGCSASIAAFLGDRASSFPFVLRVFVPSYHKASTGLASMNAQYVLQPTDVGFAQLAQLFMNLAARGNAKDLIAPLSVQKFELGDPMLGFGEKTGGLFHPVNDSLDGRISDPALRTCHSSLIPSR